MPQGYIYVLSNPAFPHLVKIGQTQRTPELRCKQLSERTGVPDDFKIEFSQKVSDCIVVEQKIHEQLQEFHHNKEFFNVSVAQAIKVSAKLADLFPISIMLPKKKLHFSELKQVGLNHLTIDSMMFAHEVIEVSSNEGGKVRWILENWRQLGDDKLLPKPKTVQKSILALSRSGRFYAHLGTDGRGWIFWSKRRPNHLYSSGRYFTVFNLPKNEVVKTMKFSPDDQWLAMGNANTNISLQKMNTTRLSQRKYSPLKYLTGHIGSINDISFSPDSKRMVSGSTDQTIKVWNLKNYDCTKTIATGESVHTVRFLHDIDYVMIGCSQIRVWNTHDAKEVLRIGHEKPFTCVEYVPKTNLVFAGNRDGILSCWNLNTGELLNQQETGLGMISQMALSPDYKKLATLHQQQQIKIWELHQ